MVYPGLTLSNITGIAYIQRNPKMTEYQVRLMDKPTAGEYVFLFWGGVQRKHFIYLIADIKQLSHE